MTYILLKGVILLAGIVGGVFLISADSFMMITNGSDVKPIAVTTSSRLNQHDAEQVEGTLFGSNQATTKPITETSLRFVLKGTIPSSKKENSFAIIQLSDRKERVISVGEELINRVVLLEVLSDYVILLRDGKREKLSFPVVNRAGLIANKAKSNTLPKNNTPRETKESSSHQINQDTSSTKSNVIESLIQPLQGVAQDIALNMYDTGLSSDQKTAFGQTELLVSNAGIKVSANSMLIGFGLKQGDTVLSVNGIPSKEFVSDSGAIAEVREAGDASVLVQRGSDTVTLNIKF